MSIIVMVLSLFTSLVFAHSVPKHTKAHAQARHRTTVDVLKSKRIPYTQNVDHRPERARRGIASEKALEKIPWKKTSD